MHGPGLRHRSVASHAQVLGLGISLRSGGGGLAQRQSSNDGLARRQWLQRWRRDALHKARQWRM
jgi:hypothetical protein